MQKIKVLSLCDGIGSGFEAFKLLGIDVEYHAIENEAWKREIADYNHPGIIRPYDDVLDMVRINFVEHYDYVLAGPTCTSLSSQGPRTDWNGESKIFFSCLDILNMAKSTNPNVKFMFENVHSMKNIIRDEISQHLGVDCFLGLSALTSAQDRKRYYWFNWNPPKLEDQKIMANDLLDEDGVLLIAFSKSNRNKVGEEAIVEGRIKTNGKSATLVTGVGCRGQSTFNNVITKKMTFRNLTVNECAKLQGLNSYRWHCSDAKAYKAIGDGWSISMVKAILKESLK